MGSPTHHIVASLTRQLHGTKTLSRPHANPRTELPKGQYIAACPVVHNRLTSHAKSPTPMTSPAHPFRITHTLSHHVHYLTGPLHRHACQVLTRLTSHTKLHTHLKSCTEPPNPHYVVAYPMHRDCLTEFSKQLFQIFNNLISLPPFFPTKEQVLFLATV